MEEKSFHITKHFMDQQASNKKRAYVTLLAVIVLSSVAVVMVTASLLISTENLQANGRVRTALEAKALAESCGEIALNKLKINTSYTGNESITLSFGSCQIQTITGAGNTNRTIQTLATKDGITKRLTIVVQTVNPTTIITSWQEV